MFHVHKFTYRHGTHLVRWSYVVELLLLAHTLPDKPSVPPRRQICSKSAEVILLPIAPCVSTATPQGLLTSCVTVISTSPAINGVRSGEDMTIFGVDAIEKSISDGPNRASLAVPDGSVTFTGILRGMTVPGWFMMRRAKRGCKENRVERFT